MTHANAIVTFYHELNKVSYPAHKIPLLNTANGLNRSEDYQQVALCDRPGEGSSGKNCCW